MRTQLNTLLRQQLAHLWPAISHIAACQKACHAVLPQLFLYCQVLRLDSNQLILSAPNSALASKLKQQLPKLQAHLEKTGWQVNAIRIKVQVKPVVQIDPLKPIRQLPATALNAFEHLEKNLTRAKHNHDLLEAVRNLIDRCKEAR
jgi:hypothetical protein